MSYDEDSSLKEMYYKWGSTLDAHTVAPRSKKQSLIFNPNTPAEKFPDPINLKVIFDPNDEGSFLEALSVSVPYPKILSEGTIAQTRDVLERNGRIIGCNISNAPMKYFAWIPTTFINALDFERSTVTRTAFVTTVRQAVLKETSAKDHEVFCIAGLPFAGVFVSKKFALSLHGISGIKLSPVEVSQ